MPCFDIGVEGNFRVNGVEAESGEAARALILKEIKERFTGWAKFERTWFQPSSESSTPSAQPKA
jgi:hypothetical protein